MTDSGWTRLTPHYAPDAVVWWFYRSFSDAYSYARGGRVRSAREARKRIRDCWDESIREHRSWRERPTHALGSEGELVPLNLPGSPRFGSAR